MLGAIDTPASSSFTDDASKKRKRGDWVVSMGVGEELDVADLPFVEGDLEVVCLSQVPRKLSDPAVGSRDCVLAMGDGDGGDWKGTRLLDFIKGVGDEMNRKALKIIGDDALSVVVYEAYKLLEEDFTAIMQSTLRMKQNASFVKRLRNFVRGAAKFQGWDFPASSVWIYKNVPFGIFVQAIVLLRDGTYSTESDRNKVDSLLGQGVRFFEEIMQEGLKNLQEDYESLNIPNVEVMEALEFMKNPANIEAAGREIVACSLLRKARNQTSHPFSPIASNAVRESALALYSSLLTHEVTKGIRNIAVLGKVKLDLLQSSELAELKQMDPSVVRDSWLLSDSEDDSSDDGLDTSPVHGLWEC